MRIKKFGPLLIRYFKRMIFRKQINRSRQEFAPPAVNTDSTAPATKQEKPIERRSRMLKVFFAFPDIATEPEQLEIQANRQFIGRKVKHRMKKGIAQFQSLRLRCNDIMMLFRNNLPAFSYYIMGSRHVQVY